MFYGQKDIIEVSFDTTLEGVILVNAHAKIVAVNDAVENCLGYAPQEVIHRKLDFFIPKHLQNIHKKHLNSFFNTSKNLSFDNSREVIGVHKNGQLVPLEFRLNKFEYNGEKYAKALIIDISNRKKKEKIINNAKMKLEKKVKDSTMELENLVSQLKYANTNLENEIKKKIIAQNEARKALIAERELSQLKNKFLSMASHEFRTPLSGILTSTVLIEKYTKQEQLNISKHTNLIKTMVRHLSNILEEFLSLDKLERGAIQYKFTEFDFSELINEVIHDAKSLLRDGQIINYTPCKGCIEVYQDKKIIHIILINILYNAIKYSPEHSAIDIKVFEKETVMISISDNGIGIPKEDQKHIFNRFYRASNTNHIQGTGIGLNIVRANINGLGGTIHFKSKENEGSTFIINLPKSVDL